MNRYRATRKACGLSARQVAESIGMSVSTVHAYERGRREPNAVTVLRLARLYGVSANWLLGMDQ